MEWSNEVVMEFLNLYEGEPVIWNPQNEDRKDRNLVYDAWKRIQSSISIECSLNELKKKKEHLMATYRKLAIKIKKSTRNGAGTDELYKPEWFAYDKMASFLHTVYTPRITKTTELQDEYEATGQSCSSQYALSDDEKPHEPSTTDFLQTTTHIYQEEQEAFTNDDEHNMVEQHSKKPRLGEKEDDRFDLIGKTLAMKMRGLPKNQMLIAERLVNETLFRAEMGLLTLNHRLVAGS